MWNKIKSKIRSIGIERNLKTKERSESEAIASGLSWFANSLQETGGSSAKYSLWEERYFPAYPETSGYWISTLLEVQDQFPAIFNEYFSEEKAKSIVNWLFSLQRTNGSFPGGYGDFTTQEPVVFNVGQILLGLTDFLKLNPDKELLSKLSKAGDWLCEVQDENGKWSKHTYCQWSSNTRTAWALIKLSDLTGENKYKNAGIKNVDYAVSLLEKGYFRYNAFEENPSHHFTHTIAYAIRGVLEVGALCNPKYIDHAKSSFEKLVSFIKTDGFLGGSIDTQFNVDESYCCLTGNCQLAIIGYRLFQLHGDPNHKKIADRLLKYVQAHQLSSDFPELNGGVTGSWPIGGSYTGWSIPNWAVKFYLEALLLKQQIKS